MLPREDRLRRIRDGIREDKRVRRRDIGAVDYELPVTHEERIAGDADNPLDERRCNLVGRYANCHILRRRDKDRDIATLGTCVARQITTRERDVWPEMEIVD